MAEKRLIDANALEEAVDEVVWYHLWNGQMFSGAHSEEDAWYKANDVYAALRAAPTVDAVEVVRCKDCKHYEIHRPKVLENCERNGYLIPMKPDDFCCYGERRTDG